MADPTALTPAQKFANMATISAAGANLASQIASVSYAGGRLYGGSVKENGMYRINENGAPEVFNAANGQQYMLPNTRGEVVSNKDASGGGMTVTNYITINTDGSVSGDGDKQAGELGKALQQAVKQGISKEMRQGGSIWQYLQKGKR
ncbi:hypothetical protein B9J93_17155 [Vibrio sp. V17_P4S1T151]|nr:hypothetical protein B9J93_17155 [Vibrio sp. V17_P4S1T151]